MFKPVIIGLLLLGLLSFGCGGDSSTPKKDPEISVVSNAAPEPTATPVSIPTTVVVAPTVAVTPTPAAAVVNLAPVGSGISGKVTITDGRPIQVKTELSGVDQATGLMLGIWTQNNCTGEVKNYPFVGAAVSGGTLTSTTRIDPAFLAIKDYKSIGILGANGSRLACGVIPPLG